MADMDDLDILRPRNPLTAIRHRREVFWQITLPMVVFVVVLLLLAVAAVGLSAPQASVWADISLIFLIIPVMFFALIVMLIFAASIYLSVRLLQVLPYYFFRAQNGFFRLNLQIGRLTNQLVEPILRIHAGNAALRVLIRQTQRDGAPRNKARKL